MSLSFAAASAQQKTSTLIRHWLLFINLTLGVYVGLPWLAPVLMKLGLPTAANIIYLIYSTQCHQLPQRSYFLFGPQTMYPLTVIQAAWRMTENPFVLRQFIGSTELGWKVAWSDRMVSLYTSVFVGGLIYALLRKRLRPLGFIGFALLALPMVLDGGTHFLSDFAGLGHGFRDTNLWLAALTHNAFLPVFYPGDALGSFNWWARLITGVLFGLGVVWLAYPRLDELFSVAQ